MDRDEVVRISRLVAFGGLTGEDTANLLLDYCTEHGKDPKLSVTFIQTIMGIGILQSYLMEALEYYEKKYTINKLQSKPNNMGQRQIILIN